MKENKQQTAKSEQRFQCPSIQKNENNETKSANSDVRDSRVNRQLAPTVTIKAFSAYCIQLIGFEITVCIITHAIKADIPTVDKPFIVNVEAISLPIGNSEIRDSELTSAPANIPLSGIRSNSTANADAR